MAVLGIVLTDATVWMGSARLPAMRRTVDGALLAVAVLGLAQLVVIASDITGEAPWASLSSLRAASRTDAGLALTLRAFMAGCAWVVLRRMELRQHDVRATALGLTGLTLMGTWAFAGHAASQRWPEIGVPIDVMHHTAAAAWIGSLTIVGLVALPTVSSDQRLDIMTRLSRTAATAVVVIVVTGSVQTVRLAGSFGAMFSDTHGRILVLKTALVAVMLAVANANRQRVRRAARRPDRAGSTSIGTLRRSVVVEFAIGLLILAITSALVVSPPGSARSDTTGDPRRPSDSYTM
jgi:copper transport protein